MEPDLFAAAAVAAAKNSLRALLAQRLTFRIAPAFLVIACLAISGAGCSTHGEERDTQGRFTERASVTTSEVTSTITIGVTTTLTGADSGNANLLIAQKANLGQAATIQSLSFYVSNAAGNLTLGIYDATGSGGGPGALLAHTTSFAPVAGWNTQPVTASVGLSSGTYWLSYLPSSNSLGFVNETATGAAAWRSFAYGPMPSSFGTPQTSGAVVNWSLYATLVSNGSTVDAGAPDASQPPTIATPASANSNPVTGTSVNLSVLGADASGEATLTYTWTTTGQPPAATTFSANGTNAAKNVTAGFAAAGTYPFQVTVTDAQGRTATSTVSVVVNATPTSIVVSPASPSVPVGKTLQFAASESDQFGHPIASSPAPTWGVSGGGSISSSGLFTASVVGGPFTVTATAGAVTGSATLNVSVATSTITIGVTSVLGGADSGNANLLFAQNATLGQTATIQSLSFYVTQASGNLTLGIYDASGAGGGPGSLLAHTASLTPVVGWNTQPVTTRLALPAGTYWLSALPSSNSLGFVNQTTTGAAAWRSFAYGAMPSSFGTPQASGVVNWSFYATLAPGGSPQVLTSVSVSPSNAQVAPHGVAQFSSVARDQNGTPMAAQPAFVWTVGSLGTISSDGLFTAGASAGGPVTVTASVGSILGSAQVTIVASSPLRLAASSNGRYLVDSSGTPYLLVGDAPHDIFANISIADAGTYLQDRAAHGFNALWCELLVGTAIGGRSDGSTYDGILPFTGKLSGGQYDLTTPNPTYFARVDQIVQLAASYGLAVLLDTFESDAWLALFQANGSASAKAWGQYLGNRYKTFENVMWITGNDFQTWKNSSADNAIAQNIMAGLAASDPNHLQTTELNYNMSGSLDDSLLVPYTKLASAYTYYPVYYEVLQEYTSAAATVPVILEETYYDGESYSALSPTKATDLMLRKAPYWTVLSGGLGGYLYGSTYYDFHSGWQAGIDTPAATQVGYWKSLFTSLPWYNLVPDQSHSVVTMGYGTATGNGSGNIQTDNYVTTARVPDGSLVVSYCPAKASIVVDMTRLRGTTTARWYDPSNGTFTAVSGSPFANSGARTFTTPGSNGAGDPDWVLVLQAP